MTAPAAPEPPISPGTPQGVQPGPWPGGPSGTAPGTWPGVPPGPGVAPLFAAPPTQRDAKRTWIGVGIGALVLVLCCAGGLTGGWVLIAGGMRETRVQAQHTVTNYLQALKQANYSTAYGMLCSELRAGESYSGYIRRHRADPVTGFTVGEVMDTSSGMAVAATVDFSQQQGVARQFVVSGDATDMHVCGGDD